MRIRIKSMNYRSAWALVCLWSFIFCGAAAAVDLGAEEVIQKHLDSIAPVERRRELKTLFIAGLSQFEAKVPEAKGGGKAVVVSDASNLYFLMSLNSREYPYEKIGVFREKLSLPFVTAGNRSPLGSFLNEHPAILSHNLFCGSMSMRWLSNISDIKKLDIKFAGKKKIDGRATYVLEVFSLGNGGGEFKVRLYFDEENFHHVRSEYRREVPIGQIVMRQQNQFTNAFLDLTEEFSDFRSVDGFTFPYKYKATFSSNAGTQAYESSWGIRVATYYLNQKLADDFFTFDVK